VALYTQCPDCSTVFRVTAEILRAAQGRVRCGICSSGFNALDNLSEAPVPRVPDEPAHEDTITVEEMPGTEFIELSGAAEPELAAGEEDDDEVARAPSGESQEGDAFAAIPDAALEFHGSPEDLERLFVPATAYGRGSEAARGDVAQAIEEVALRDLSGIEVREGDFAWSAVPDTPFDPGNPAHVAAVLASAADRQEAAAADDLERTDEYPVLVVEEYEQAQAATGTPATSEDGDAAVGEEAVPQEPGDDAEPAGDEHAAGGQLEPADAETADGPDASGESPSAEAVLAADETPLLIIPEELRRGPSATAADDFAAPLGLEDEAARRWPVIAAAAVLAAVLAAQAVHHWRDGLVRHPVTGPWLLRAYAALGAELAPPVDLAAFELRQLGAASDPVQAGRIKVRASLVNHAPFAQPYPLLRLTLQDRFGSTIGARNLVPAEYLPGAAVGASGLLGAAQRADAEVVFVDPGRDAVGFELDVCTEGDSGLRCSADLPRRGP